MYILLCGYPPFKGKTHKEIFDKIKIGKFAFPYAEWDKVSGQAKMLITKMLTFNPSERISAEKALNDTWLVTHTQQPLSKKVTQMTSDIMEGIL